MKIKTKIKSLKPCSSVFLHDELIDSNILLLSSIILAANNPILVSKYNAKIATARGIGKGDAGSSINIKMSGIPIVKHAPRSGKNFVKPI